MYSIKGKQAARIEPVTFSELNMTENDIEEVLRNSIDMICDEEESMLIVGRQVRNEKNGRSDLTAVDNNGNIVLIEIKRDRKDIEHRKEAFEFHRKARTLKPEHPSVIQNQIYFHEILGF